jgi:hypothetical protein
MVFLAVALLAGCASPIRLYPDPTARNAPMPMPPMPPDTGRQQYPEPEPAVPDSVEPPSVSILPLPEPAPPLSVIPAPNALPMPIPNGGLSSPLPDDKLSLLRDWIEQQRRLYQVAAPLLMNNTQLCPQFSRRILGFTAKNQYSYSSEFTLVAHDGLGLDERLQIANVLPRSGAEVAGLQRGDILVSSAERPLATGPDAERAAASQLADATEGNSAVELTVQRGDENISTTVRLTPACAMVIDLGNADAPSSYADGRRVMISRGMLGFVQSDTELAYVLARQIAANITGPGPKPEVAALIDRLHTLKAASAQSASAGLQTVAGEQAGPGIPPVSPEVSAAADRLALYLLARAGVPLSGVHDFWARLAETVLRDQPASPSALNLPVADRLAMIDREIGVIEMKQKKGNPLVP